MTKPQDAILEVKELSVANELLASEEWRLERYSEHRNCYILVRRKK